MHFYENKLNLMVHIGILKKEDILTPIHYYQEQILIELIIKAKISPCVCEIHKYLEKQFFLVSLYL